MDIALGSQGFLIFFKLCWKVDEKVWRGGAEEALLAGILSFWHQEKMKERSFAAAPPPDELFQDCKTLELWTDIKRYDRVWPIFFNPRLQPLAWGHCVVHFGQGKLTEVFLAIVYSMHITASHRRETNGRIHLAKMYWIGIEWKKNLSS